MFNIWKKRGLEVCSLFTEPIGRPSGQLVSFVLSFTIGLKTFSFYAKSEVGILYGTNNHCSLLHEELYFIFFLQSLRGCLELCWK